MDTLKGKALHRCQLSKSPLLVVCQMHLLNEQRVMLPFFLCAKCFTFHTSHLQTNVKGHWEQFGVEFFSQGHFNIQPERNLNRQPCNPQMDALQTSLPWLCFLLAVYIQYLFKFQKCLILTPYRLDSDPGSHFMDGYDLTKSTMVLFTWNPYFM